MQRNAIGPSLLALGAIAALLAGCSGGSSSVTPGSPPQALGQSHAAVTTTNESSLSDYRVIALNGLGGSVAAGISDNDLGAISGYSSLASNTAVHAALWYPGSTTAHDLGTLGGTNSAVTWPNHNLFEVVGISQTAQTDPLGEQWSCSAFIPYSGQTCLGFVWRGGHMTKLPTLGGNNGFATGSNARGDVVGWAETTTHDSTCVAPQVLQFEAVLWDAAGHPHVLPPLPGDPDSAATAIDDEGDAAGISGICQNAVGDLSAEHAVVWHQGVPTNIGNLGGAAWNTPMAINDRGAVVGFSDLPGDEDGANPNSHAFLWTQSAGIVDLGTVQGDTISEAYGINNRGQIVGQSCADITCASSRAFLYENGEMYDLNALVVPAGSAYDLIFANDINDEGQITGLAVDENTGDAVAFRLVPARGVFTLDTTSARSVESSTRVRSALQKLELHRGLFGRMLPQVP
jgi:probable HAF family extracellular repeat protein